AGNPELGSFYLGLVGVARAGPALVFGLLAGVLADRADKRRLLMMASAAQAAIAAAFALLVATPLLSFPVLIVLCGLSAGLAPVAGPGRVAALPRLLGTTGVIGGLSLIRSANHSATLIGPLLGGVLIGPLGSEGVMIAAAVCNLVAVAMLLPLGPIPSESGA